MSLNRLSQFRGQVQWADRNEMPDSAPTPSERDIRAQLSSMLACQRFKTAQNPAAFLEFIVNRELNKKQITEDIVGRHLFGSKFSKDESTDVRVTASNLRKALDKYYLSEGANDLVIITLSTPSREKGIRPARGEAYRPQFRFNANHAVSVRYGLGLSYLPPKLPLEFDLAIGAFLEVLELAPEHSGACIGLTETMCLLPLMGWGSYYTVQGALHFAKEAVRFAPNHWHAWAALGTAHLLCREPDSATLAFQTALRFDENGTRNYAGYQLFLLVLGQVDHALQYAYARATQKHNEAQSQFIYACWLYATRDLIKAREIIEFALALDGNSWYSRLLLALIKYSSADADRAFSEIFRAMYISQATKSVLLWPGLTALMASVSKRANYQRIYDTAAKIISKDGDSWFQCVLLMLGSPYHASIPERNQAVLDCLYNSWINLEPFLLLANTLPLFDALREEERFKALINDRLAPSPLEVTQINLEVADMRNAFREYIQTHRHTPPEAVSSNEEEDQL